MATTTTPDSGPPDAALRLATVSPNALNQSGRGGRDRRLKFHELSGNLAVVVWGPQRAGTLRATVRPRAGTRFGRTELLPRVGQIALPVAGFDPGSGRPTLIAIAHRTLITITRNR